MIRLHKDANGDLQAISLVDAVAAGRLRALIQQLAADEDLVSRLLDHNYGDSRTAEISVMKWLSVQRHDSLPVWRVKFWALEDAGMKYRLIYCFHYRDQSYNILGIAPRRELDYDDPSNVFRKRIVACIERLFPDA